MNISEHLIDVLVARGMTRRRIGALLRALDQNDDVIGRNEARHHLAMTLGTTSPPFAERGYFSFSTDSYLDQEVYRMTIAEGVELISYEYGANDHPTGCNVVLRDQDPPQAIIAALLNGPLTKLIDHPLLPRDAVITHVKVDDGEMKVAIAMRGRTAGSEVLAPVSMLGMQLEALAIARERHREAVDANALKGYTMGTLIRSAIATTIALAFGTCVSLSGGGPTWALAAPLVTAMLCGIVTYPGTRREDPYLKPRLDDARRRKLQERRDAIYEGRIKE